MRLIYLIFSSPIIILCAILYLFSKNIRNGLHISRIKLADGRKSKIDPTLIGYLLAGEDHRFYAHPGFDLVAIFRAMLSLIRNKRLEGASTIEQQYVRTCTARYELSISRKIEEIAISSLLSSLEDKDTIALSYLENAYYGYSTKDFGSASREIGSIYPTEEGIMHHGAAIIALLKNPIPHKVSDSWKMELSKRALYIERKYTKLNLANKSFQPSRVGIAHHELMPHNPWLCIFPQLVTRIRRRAQ